MILCLSDSERSITVRLDAVYFDVVNDSYFRSVSGLGDMDMGASRQHHKPGETKICKKVGRVTFRHVLHKAICISIDP